mmetsp:Transcript_29716/g.81369  ORF Transcript_29716/g.81369 Transcript_29716/m.81369 type:complete len:238 (-) Transcript_29716:39-752(-)
MASGYGRRTCLTSVLKPFPAFSLTKSMYSRSCAFLRTTLSISTVAPGRKNPFARIASRCGRNSASSWSKTTASKPGIPWSSRNESKNAPKSAVSRSLNGRYRKSILAVACPTTRRAASSQCSFVSVLTIVLPARSRKAAAALKVPSPAWHPASKTTAGPESGRPRPTATLISSPFSSPRCIPSPLRSLKPMNFFNAASMSPLGAVASTWLASSAEPSPLAPLTTIAIASLQNEGIAA